MISRVRKFLANRKRLDDQLELGDSLYDNGYNRAAGQLLRGLAPELLEVVVDGLKALGPFEREQFQSGARAAIRDWKNRK